MKDCNGCQLLVTVIQELRMDTQLSMIKVLIWDFDGTLYKPNRDIWHNVREAEYKTIAEHTRWPREKVIAEFEKTYKAITPSATEAVAYICKMKTEDAAVEMERYYDRRPYLSRDPKLVALFQKLRSFRHFILANGVVHRIEETLAVLGIPRSTFEEIVTSEVVGVNKPHEKGFRYILEKTKLSPAFHLMIGDREAVDLAPAKAIGMKTCLVWSETKSLVADITLPTVYLLEKILL